MTWKRLTLWQNPASYGFQKTQPIMVFHENSFYAGHLWQNPAGYGFQKTQNPPRGERPKFYAGQTRHIL